MTVTNEHDAPVVLSVRHRTGLIELNRPKALNSLNPEMLDIITKALRMWGPDDDIDQVVVFSSHPKAFCAGGDVRHARSEVLEGGDPDSFFEAEYAMNAALSEFPKPYIAVLDGVAMGGGLGISLHGSHRIVTDKAFASMPEMAIGYVTDVGVPYMSQRTMSTALAKFWGVTGYRMYAADLLYTGLATGYTEDPAAFIEDVVAHGISSAQLSDAAVAAGMRGFGGFGIGGALEKENLGTIVGWVCDELPEDKPRHLLGISEPDDLFTAIEAGADTFDCVAPTRLGRRGGVYTLDGRLNLMGAKFKRDFKGIDEEFGGYVSENYSRAYIHHLLKAHEFLAGTLCTMHNLEFMIRLVDNIRASIDGGYYEAFRDEFMGRYYAKK